MNSEDSAESRRDGDAAIGIVHGCGAASLAVEGACAAPPSADRDRLRAALQQRLEVTFHDPELFVRALTHRSVPLQNAQGRFDYERLEFLGDAVLDLSVAHLLLEVYPEATEGDLSKMRAALVNTQALAEMARRLEVGPCIRLSRGESAHGGNDRASILADVMEALIGAVYRDAGFTAAFELVRRLVGPLAASVTPRDPKTELQEALHISGRGSPEYQIEMVEGPEHAPQFVSIVLVEKRIVGRGSGTTKKASQQAAASAALQHMKEEQQAALAAAAALGADQKERADQNEGVV